MTLEGAVSDFVAEAKSLCQRMLFSDRIRLNATDLHVLRAQLKVLDAEAANLEYLLSSSFSRWKDHNRGKTAWSHHTSTIKNPPYSQKKAERTCSSGRGRSLLLFYTLTLVLLHTFLRLCLGTRRA